MLNCVYHPTDDMRVVDDAERENLISSGFWFDSPEQARQYRLEVEKDLKAKKEKSKDKEKHYEK